MEMPAFSRYKKITLNLASKCDKMESRQVLKMKNPPLNISSTADCVTLG